MALVDTSQEGDGIRTYKMWKSDFINVIATGHQNYAELTFNFIAQVELLLSQRKSAQLLNDRKVNVHGEEGRKVQIDYALELLSGEVKPDPSDRYGNLTQDIIDRVGKSLKSFKDIADNIEKQLGKLYCNSLLRPDAKQ